MTFDIINFDVMNLFPYVMGTLAAIIIIDLIIDKLIDMIKKGR